MSRMGNEVLHSNTHAAARRGKPRDRRIVALAVTAGAIALIGGVIAFGPDLASRDGSGTTTKPSVRAAVNPEIDQRFQQAVIMLHAKRYDHAVTALHRVLELAPQMPEAHVNMGYAMLGLGRPAVARDFFESATALRPQQVNAYFGLAMAHEALGELPAAIGAMRTYLHLSPKDDPHARKAASALWEWESKRAPGDQSKQ